MDQANRQQEVVQLAEARQQQEQIVKLEAPVLIKHAIVRK